MKSRSIRARVAPWPSRTEQAMATAFSLSNEDLVRRPTSEKSVDIVGVNERFRYESPRKPTPSAVMLLEKT